MKAQLKPTYASEQASYRECCLLRGGSSIRHERMFPQRAVNWWEVTIAGPVSHGITFRLKITLGAPQSASGLVPTTAHHLVAMTSSGGQCW
jgi:hypothetical protein